MKKVLFIAIVLLSTLTKMSGQSTDKDFVLVGQVSGDPNMVQVEMRYSRVPNTCFVTVTDLNPISKLVSALNGNRFENLHVFVRTSPGELILNKVVITADNVGKYSAELAELKKSVTGIVIIHSMKVFQSEAGAQLKTKLEQLTGLVIKESI